MSWHMNYDSSLSSLESGNICLIRSPKQTVLADKCLCYCSSLKPDDCEGVMDDNFVFNQNCSMNPETAVTCNSWSF